MYNRSQRRQLDKQHDVKRIIGSLPKKLKEGVLEKRKQSIEEERKQWKEEQERLSNDRKLERYTKSLQMYVEKMGYDPKDAEAILEELEKRDMLRKKRKNKTL